MKLSFILGRLLSAIPTLLILTFLVFIALHLVPGDVVDIMLGTQNFLSEEQVQQLYSRLGLDKPLMVQYGLWLKNFFTFNLGTSLRTGEPVAKMIVEKFPVTFELALFSIVFSMLLGVPLGIFSAVKRNSKPDYVIRVLGLVGLSAPAFWIGAIFIVLVSGAFVNFTLFGFVPLFKNPGVNLQVMLFPSITLGMMVAAQIMRMSRNSMLDVLSQEYVRVARAKGLPAKKVILKHALRNALVPVVTTAGIQLGYLMGGTIVIENMFALPGMGRLLLQAVNQRDYPVVQGVVAFIGVLIVLLNILVDILYSLIDPRIELG
ncbi:MAG TPA: ABC transporter permease [Thermotogota bacterium]|nr:ABC transporter permease [Thermotogota bacterium]HRW92741.1 ABC transporter permease [Thermotogota bacterium]